MAATTSFCTFSLSSSTNQNFANLKIKDFFRQKCKSNLNLENVFSLGLGNKLSGLLSKADIFFRNTLLLIFSSEILGCWYFLSKHSTADFFYWNTILLIFSIKTLSTAEIKCWSTLQMIFSIETLCSWYFLSKHLAANIFHRNNFQAITEGGKKEDPSNVYNFEENEVVDTVRALV